MRGCNKIFEVTERVVVKKIAVKEEIVVENKDFVNKYIEIGIQFYDVNNEAVSNENWRIQDEDYELLMSEYPDFSPDKKGGEYSREDIWKIIDLMRER